MFEKWDAFLMNISAFSPCYDASALTVLLIIHELVSLFEFFFKNSFCMKVGSHWFQEAGNVLYDLNDYCDIAEEPSSKLIFVFSSDTVVSFHNLQMCLDVADLTPALVFISMQKRIWLVWLGYIITGPRYRFPCFGGPTEWVPSRTHSEGDEFHRNALFPLYLSKNWG